MEIIFIIGCVITLIGGIGLLIAAFKTSLLWGFGCLLLTPVSIVFLFMYWDEAKNPFLLQLLGLGLIFIGSSAA